MKKGQSMPESIKQKLRGDRLGVKMKKQFERVCHYCGESFKSAHSDKKFCSYKCIDKNNYHNNSKGEKQRAKRKIEILKRNEAIGSCSLCGIKHNEIKTMSELGSNVFNGGSYFMKDHIIPKSMGGGDEATNIRQLCWFCNLTRKDMSIMYDEAIKKAAIAFWETINKTND